MKIDFVKKVKDQRISKALVQKVVTATLQKAGFKEKNIEMSVFLVGKKRITRLNKEFRKKDETTDTLSFSQLEGETVSRSKGAPVYLGDIFICKEVADVQAKDLNHSYTQEIITLLVHSTLHVLGYDHIKENDFKKMHALENTVLRSLL